MINKYVRISAGQRYKWCQVCVFISILSDKCTGQGFVIAMDGVNSFLTFWCSYENKEGGGSK